MEMNSTDNEDSDRSISPGNIRGLLRKDLIQLETGSYLITPTYQKVCLIQLKITQRNNILRCSGKLVYGFKDMQVARLGVDQN
jgi:hypothetical protein